MSAITSIRQASVAHGISSKWEPDTSERNSNTRSLVRCLNKLNLSFSPSELHLRHPDYLFRDLEWTHLHPPETFSFWKIRLRSVGDPDLNVPGLVYWPHPETKVRHWQSRSTLEILSPYIDHVFLGQSFELGVNPTAIRVCNI